MLMAGLRSGIADPAMSKAQALLALAAQVRREAYVSAYSDAFCIQIAEMQGDKASVEKYDKRHSDTNRSVELLKEVVKFASERENGN